MQLKDSQNSLGYIHRFLCGFWIDRWHLIHSWPGSMQEYSYPVNTSGQRSNHSQIHIVVWHSLKEGRKYRACIMGGNVKSFYPVHKCHHSQLMYPQDKYMPHSWWKCQWPHTAETWSKGCWQDKGFDKFHSCKSILEDSPCPLDTQVLQLQQLKLGKHMHYKRVRFLQLLSISTYALNKLHNHLLSRDICRCRSLCDLWQCNQLLWHNCLDYKGLGIPFE